MTEYETELRELSEFVLELVKSEEYLYFKFEKGLSLEIRAKISITETQSYKEVVQLALRVKKLTGEKISRSSFQKKRVQLHFKTVFEEDQELKVLWELF